MYCTQSLSTLGPSIHPPIYLSLPTHPGRSPGPATGPVVDPSWRPLDRRRCSRRSVTTTTQSREVSCERMTSETANHTAGGCESRRPSAPARRRAAAGRRPAGWRGAGRGGGGGLAKCDCDRRAAVGLSFGRSPSIDGFACGRDARQRRRRRRSRSRFATTTATAAMHKWDELRACQPASPPPDCLPVSPGVYFRDRREPP